MGGYGHSIDAINNLVKRWGDDYVKAIYIRSELLNSMNISFETGSNSDGEIWFAGIPVYVNDNLDVPFRFDTQDNRKEREKVWTIHNAPY